MFLSHEHKNKVNNNFTSQQCAYCDLVKWRDWKDETSPEDVILDRYIFLLNVFEACLSF